MKRYEYIKWHVQEFSGNLPLMMIYEIDLQNERYATRMADIFEDRSVKPFINNGFEFVTEGAVPDCREINTDKGHFAEEITKEEFERIYTSKKYDGTFFFNN